MLVITLVSLVVAAAAGFIAWRSIRREHLRADARVALLATAIDSSEAPGHTAPDDALAGFGEEAAAPAAPALFDEQAAPSGRGRPLLTAAAGLSVILAIIVLIAMTGDRYDTPPPGNVSQPGESLELLSLQAARDGGALEVTGLVRNRADEPLNAITAIVSAIGADGRPVASGSTALAALPPGRESRFVVIVDDVHGVARYRVSFRGATGVIRHLDRRAGRTDDES